MVYKPDSVP